MEKYSLPVQIRWADIDQNRHLDREFTATDIHSLCESSDIAIPGLRDGVDEDKAKRVVGTIMAKLFIDSDTLDVDGYHVIREERYVARGDVNAGGGFKAKTYTVRKRRHCSAVPRSNAATAATR